MNKTLLTLLALGSLALSCGSTTVGNPCTGDAECDPGQSCFLTGFPGGFCTRGCEHDGAINECPAGTICARSSGSALFCTTICTDDGACRGGEYTCKAIAGSDKKACAP